MWNTIKYSHEDPLSTISAICPKVMQGHQKVTQPVKPPKREREKREQIIQAMRHQLPSPRLEMQGV